MRRWGDSRAAYPPEWVEPDKAFVAKKLGISREEFDAIMAPRRSVTATTPICKITGYSAGTRSIPVSET